MVGGVVILKDNGQAKIPNPQLNNPLHLALARNFQLDDPCGFDLGRSTRQRDQRHGGQNRHYCDCSQGDLRIQQHLTYVVVRIGSNHL